MDQNDNLKVQLQIAENDVIFELPTKSYNETLKRIVIDNLKTSIEDCDVSIIPGSAKGDNYMGIMYRVAITSKEGDKLNLTVKLAPQDEIKREQFYSKDVFLREIEFYDNVYTMYKKFQEEKGIDVINEGFSQVPRVYATLIEAPCEGLFFEDLKALGFQMHNRLKDIRLEHVQLLMKSLGKLHAISFSIKDQKPELIEKYKEIKDIFLMRDKTRLMDAVNIWFAGLTTQAFESIKDLEDEELKKKYKAFIQNDFNVMLGKGISKESAEPYAILNHGDCWNNNFMYHNDKSGIPDDIRLLDFQQMRYCSPVCDLVHFIFGCTTKEFRDKHYLEILDLYYETLSSFMTRLGSDPNKVFPREVFEDHLKKFGNFGLTMAIIILPLSLSEGDEIFDLDEMSDKFKKAVENNEPVSSEITDMSKKKCAKKYYERIRGVLQDMKKYEYI